MSKPRPKKPSRTAPSDDCIGRMLEMEVYFLRVTGILTQGLDKVSKMTDPVEMAKTASDYLALAEKAAL